MSQQFFLHCLQVVSNLTAGARAFRHAADPALASTIDPFCQHLPPGLLQKLSSWGRLVEQASIAWTCKWLVKIVHNCTILFRDPITGNAAGWPGQPLVSMPPLRPPGVPGQPSPAGQPPYSMPPPAQQAPGSYFAPQWALLQQGLRPKCVCVWFCKVCLLVMQTLLIGPGNITGSSCTFVHCTAMCATIIIA